MSFQVEPEFEREMEAIIARYPQRRSAALMLLHAVQEREGHISRAALEWIAAKLEVEPIAIFELVTFYPMFRQQPAGRYVFKVCRTLSCALGGSRELYRYLCEKLGLDPRQHGLQTTADGRFSIEFVECLASCGAAPALMVNDEFYEGVTLEKADHILASLRQG